MLDADGQGAEESREVLPDLARQVTFKVVVMETTAVRTAPCPKGIRLVGKDGIFQSSRESLSPRPRVCLVVDLGQMLEIQVGVNLGGADIRVA